MYLNARERMEERQLALRAYLAGLESLDRRNEQIHETVRVSIALATGLIEMGQTEVALELLARVSPAISASRLSLSVDGRQ